MCPCVCMHVRLMVKKKRSVTCPAKHPHNLLFMSYSINTTDNPWKCWSKTHLNVRRVGVADTVIWFTWALQEMIWLIGFQFWKIMSWRSIVFIYICSFVECWMCIQCYKFLQKGRFNSQYFLDIFLERPSCIKLFLPFNNMRMFLKGI